MKIIMRLITRIIIYISFTFYSFTYTHSVYYEPNSDIKDYLDNITESFTKISSYSKIWADSIPSEIFNTLKTSFLNVKDKLPQNPKFKVIYENCYLTSQGLSDSFEQAKLDTFNSQCFWPWKSISREIFTDYAVQAKIKTFPSNWNAPLTVTFDWRSSIDPSSDTIPTNNYYWYYKDSNGKTQLIGQWPVVKHTFYESNDYVVHLTVKSSNKSSEGILDGSSSTTVSVAPPIANLSLYIQWQRAYKDSYIKLSSEEWKNWVLFDATWTTPAWSTKITSSFWEIRKDNKIIYKREVPNYPWSVKVNLPENGFYDVSLWIKDNTWKAIEETYRVIVSNPVSLIKIWPETGNTSSKFIIDGSPSYSVNWKIDNYKWTIVWPDGSRIDSFQWKKNFEYKFNKPWIYAITLEVQDINWDNNEETYKLNVESTSPVPNFVYEKYDNWEKPSTFIFDASYSSDVDEKYWDSLNYSWNFSNSENIKTQSINNWEKIIAQFNKLWKYDITLTVKDKYGKSSSITKSIEIESTLRPEISINPNYTVIWKPIAINVNTNKSVAYYEYFFWDGENSKTQSDFVEHTYDKAWVYDLKINVSSVDGDSNSINKKVFIWQRWAPLGIYHIYKWDNQQLTSTYCPVPRENWTWNIFVEAYEIGRMQNFTIDASKSVNWKWTDDMLNVYFRKENSNENILKNKLNINFDELWCKRIDLYVQDLSTNKLDKKSIYFKVVNTKPELKDLSMYFPQYAGNQWTNSFQPQVWNYDTPKDIFEAWFDPLLVKLTAKWAKDPDSPFISNYRWYYYRKWDRSNLIDVKETPYNINQIVFSVPKIPWEYIFWVDVCDVDWECTNSEDYLKSKLIVNIPPSSENPDIPQVNSVRIDKWNEKWVWEVNVWEKISIKVNSEILSNKSDFNSTRTIKYDFDNDWNYDLTTKKEEVEHIFKKPWKYKVKVKVVYRWYGWIWYSTPIIVKEWLKPMIDLTNKGHILLYNDLSFWNIKEKQLCFDMIKCKNSPSDFLVKNKDYWYINYTSSWNKLLLFNIKDDYGNEKILRKRISIKDDKNSFLLSLPENNSNRLWYNIVAAWMYEDYIIVYYKSENDNCFIDKNISIDSNQDNDTTNDKDLSCNKVYKLNYTNIPEVSLRIHDGEDKKDIKVEFANLKLSLPSEYKKQYEKLQAFIDKYSQSNENTYFVKLLSDLLNNLDDKIDKDAILIQLNDYIDENNIEDKEEIKSLILSLSDKSTQAAFWKEETVIDNLRMDIEIILQTESNKEELDALFKELENTTSKEERKSILQNILNIWLNMKKAWEIDDESLQIIKTSICSLLKYYEIPSQLCWTGIDDKNIKKTNSWFTMRTILKIVWRILAIFLIIFIIIVTIFIIKAKKNREENSKEE